MEAYQTTSSHRLNLRRSRQLSYQQAVRLSAPAICSRMCFRGLVQYHPPWPEVM